MLTSIVRFSDDVDGVEKALRLVQYGTLTAATLLGPQDSKPWNQAHVQSALGRRYFRLLKWHGSFGFAYKEFNNPNRSALRKALEVAKWSFLGLYYFFEMFTITNAMGITDYDWAPGVQLEADKYWMYAIIASIFVSLHQLFFTAAATDDRRDEKRAPSPSSNGRIYRQLAIDCADVVIPLVGVGWVAWDEMWVGIAGTISSLLGAQEIWTGVQSRFTNVGP